MMEKDLKTKLAESLEQTAKEIRNYDLDAKYNQYVKPVENTIQKYPIQSVLVGVGSGILIGVLVYKYCNRNSHYLS